MESQRPQKVRVRHPEGQATLVLASTTTVGSLLRQITEKTGLSAFDLKFGYPPRQLLLEGFEENTTLSKIDIKLDGEQLIVSQKFPFTSHELAGAQQTEMKTPFPSSTPVPPDGTPAAPPSSSSRKSDKSLSLSRKAKRMDQDAPEIPLPLLNATLVLRIMPDDNSCLFRAFNTAFFGFMDNMTELRSVIAQNIQSHPDAYSAIVLEKEPDDYCRWIQTENAWGGAIELDILSKHFDVEICSIDVQTLRTDRYNEGRQSRCILVYSGIHYDAIALSPSDPPHTHSVTPPEFDTKVFDSADELILQASLELCRALRKQHYFTDTAKFSIMCNVCGSTMNGERGATEHAMRTGHMDFGEAG